ncbi:MAG: PAS domain-containing protein, partial [Candidatus Omnitrophota bacterium]|nr:PAS domain-containing protein [Candidatus Omnitrophota bacterium]
KDIQGKFCYKITHRVDAPCSGDDACPLIESIAGKRDAKELHVHYDSSGRKSFVEVTCYPILNAEGQPGEIIHISRDITDEVEAKEKIKLYVDELEKTKVKLTAQLRELESFGKLSVDREIKMIELKKKIKDMETQA